MKGVALSAFSDIHTHGRTGADIICSIEPEDAEILERSIPGRAWFSVGIHPWSTGVSIPESTFELLDKLSSDERVAAIGEAGLDALRGGEASYQEEVFLRQAALAEKVRKPLIIHCVRRYGRLMELYATFRPQQLWVIHGFRGKSELARQLARQGIGISTDAHPRADIDAVVPPHLRFHETDMMHEADG